MTEEARDEAMQQNPVVNTEVLRKQIKATIYGQCIGDAIGLLTEFMSKEQAKKHYKRPVEYKNKVDDRHRCRWKTGDWTDDSDQMFLIMRSLKEHNGEANQSDFAKKLRVWIQKGFVEFEDTGGMGLGATTLRVTQKVDYEERPEEAARVTWIEMKRSAAPNGGVMRTSVVGTCHWQHCARVAENAKAFCKTTHYDPRCVASSVAVSVAVSVMLQGETDVKKVIEKAYQYAAECFEEEEDKLKLREVLEVENLSDLNLDEERAIGFTYKCLGAGFWALKQKDFRAALEEILMSGGDADTNGAVAGALLGCRLADIRKLPRSWVRNLCHRDWLDKELEEYMDTVVLPEEAGMPKDNSNSSFSLFNFLRKRKN